MSLQAPKRTENFFQSWASPGFARKFLLQKVSSNITRLYRTLLNANGDVSWLIHYVYTSMLFTRRRRCNSQCLTDGVNARDMGMGLISSIIDMPLNFQTAIFPSNMFWTYGTTAPQRTAKWVSSSRSRQPIVNVTLYIYVVFHLLTQKKKTRTLMDKFNGACNLLLLEQWTLSVWWTSTHHYPIRRLSQDLLGNKVFSQTA